jgi:hypothetical protein
VDGDLGGNVETEPYPASSNFQNSYLDLLANPNALSRFTAQDQHSFTLPDRNFLLFAGGVCPAFDAHLMPTAADINPMIPYRLMETEGSLRMNLNDVGDRRLLCYQCWQGLRC